MKICLSIKNQVTRKFIFLTKIRCNWKSYFPINHAVYPEICLSGRSAYLKINLPENWFTQPYLKIFLLIKSVYSKINLPNRLGYLSDRSTQQINLPENLFSWWISLSKNQCTLKISLYPISLFTFQIDSLGKLI